MSFNEEFLHGYKKYAKTFDLWCEKAYPIMGKVTQCGITEFDNSGDALIATNRPDFGESYIDKQGYILDTNWTYADNLDTGFKMQCSNEGLSFLQNNELNVFGKNFDVWYGFSFLEKINDNSYRLYFFASDNPIIYDKLANNTSLIKKFIKSFKENNEQILSYYRDRKFNLLEKKENYLLDIPCYRQETEREKTLSLLRQLNISDVDLNITKREWDCFDLYRKGKSASQTGKILSISRRTVETHFNNLKDKLRVKSKSELMEYLN